MRIAQAMQQIAAPDAASQASLRPRTRQAQAFQAQASPRSMGAQTPEAMSGAVFNRFDMGSISGGQAGAPEGVGGTDLQFSERSGVSFATKG